MYWDATIPEKYKVVASCSKKSLLILLALPTQAQAVQDYNLKTLIH
jgi:hypothetical protein